MRHLVLALVTLGLAAGCTFSAVTPRVVTAPPAPPPSTLVLGEITAVNPSWQAATVVFKRGVSDWLGRNGGFQGVLIEAPLETRLDSVVLRGTIIEVDKGSAALRFFVGMGAGQAQVKGVFDLARPDGSVLATFTARESYLGGVGIGGAGLLDVDDLMRRFGETVAKTTRDWARGEGIK
ncbi:MAG TPA: DUF4410 domain-containing protein [Candidatus Nitrosotalea sp.]|nr:DUF4410 domain-containing protein [Candidatus Nitrosotalea sp.]